MLGIALWQKLNLPSISQFQLFQHQTRFILTSKHLLSDNVVSNFPEDWLSLATSMLEFLEKEGIHFGDWGGQPNDNIFYLSGR